MNAQGIDEHMINVHCYYYCCQYLYKRRLLSLFVVLFPLFLLGVGMGGCFEFELLKEQPNWFIFCQWRAGKNGLVMCLLLLPHMSTLFMMLLIQTAGHKMAAPMVVFCTTFKQFLSKKTRNQVKNCAHSLSLSPSPPPPTPMNRALDSSSLSVPFI